MSRTAAQLSRRRGRRHAASKRAACGLRETGPPAPRRARASAPEIPRIRPVRALPRPSVPGGICLAPPCIRRVLRGVVSYRRACAISTTAPHPRLYRAPERAHARKGVGLALWDRSGEGALKEHGVRFEPNFESWKIAGVAQGDAAPHRTGMRRGRPPRRTYMGGRVRSESARRGHDRCHARRRHAEPLAAAR